MGARKIVFNNRKGGVGKTVSAVNVAAALLFFEKKVLLLDLDSQAHTTLSLGVKGKERMDMVAFLKDQGYGGLSPLRVRDYGKGLFLIPSSFALSDYEREVAKDPRGLLTLKKCISAFEEEFDFIIMDTPPNFGFMTLSAYLAATEIVVPMPPHFLALKALAETKVICEKVARKNPGLRISKVLLTFFNKNLRHARSVIQEIRKMFGQDILLPPVRNSVRLAEAPSFGQTIFEYAPQSKVAEDYKKVAAALLEEGEGGRDNREEQGS